MNDDVINPQKNSYSSDKEFDASNYDIIEAPMMSSLTNVPNAECLICVWFHFFSLSGSRE